MREVMMILALFLLLTMVYTSNVHDVVNENIKAIETLDAKYRLETQKLKDEIQIYKGLAFLWKKPIRVRVSAYTPSADECDDTPWITACNTRTTPGRTAAVSRDLMYLLGEWINIPGQGEWFVEDLMNSRHKQSIDLCKPTKSMAREFGVKHLKVYRSAQKDKI